MIVDYFFIRKKELAAEELYARQGSYTYSGGFNLIAIFAMLAGILPNVPGFLVTVKLVSQDFFPAWLTQLYHYAWFVGFAVSGMVYYVGMKQRKTA